MGKYRFYSIVSRLACGAALAAAVRPDTLLR